MASANLSDMKVAILVENGFEQVELTKPRRALDQAGADTRVVSPRHERTRLELYGLGRRGDGRCSAGPRPI
jgi:protease I